MPVIPFPSERVFNSATFMYGHIVLTTIRKFSNLHLKNIFAATVHVTRTIHCSALCDDVAHSGGSDVTLDVTRCNGLRMYAVCGCNTVRLPGTGQSAHVIGGSRFTRPASNSRRTLMN